MSEQTRVSVNAFLVKDNKILLGKRLVNAGFGQWGLPGGHLEYKESLSDAIRRELREEIGIEATSVQFAQVVNDTQQERHYIHINFIVTEWTGEIVNKEPEKCEKWDWFDLEQLPENIFFAHKKFFAAPKLGEQYID